MKVTQLEKRVDILLGDDRDDLYFLERRLIKRKGVSIPGNFNLFSTRVRGIPFDKLIDYIHNPVVTLVKVESEDA